LFSESHSLLQYIETKGGTDISSDHTPVAMMILSSIITRRKKPILTIQKYQLEPLPRKSTQSDRLKYMSLKIKEDLEH